MARSGLRMMPTFPLPSLKFRTAGFPQYGFKAGMSDKAFPSNAALAALSLPSSFVLPARTVRSPFCAGGRCALVHLRLSGSAALPQGPSLRSGFFCPGPSTLNRPHPPHSQAHPDFAACGLYEMPSLCTLRLGDLRVVPRFHDMPSSTTPERSQPVCSRHAVPT